MKIIYIYFTELSKGEPEMFGVNYFLNLGYDLEIWYCYRIIQKNYTPVKNPDTEIKFKVIESFENLNDCPVWKFIVKF